VRDSLLHLNSFVRGTHTPRSVHSARWGEGFPMSGLARRGGSRLPMFFLLSTYPFGARDCKREINKTKIAYCSDV